MQQSDAMLISSLKQYISIPNEISTMKDINAQHIFSLACSVFEALKIDYSELKQISKAQKFRSLTKLTQIINQEMDTTFELSDIMNPTLPIIRKILLAFISKMGVMQGERTKVLISQSSDGAEKRSQRQMLKRWISSEHIHPELQITTKVQYQPHFIKLQLKKQLFKRNIVSQLLSIDGNANSIIRSTITREVIQRKKREADEGFTKKINEEHERNFQKISKNNVDDWGKVDVLLKKVKKQLGKIEEKYLFGDAVGTSSEGITKEMSIFQQEVSKISEEQKKMKEIEEKKSQLKSSQSPSKQQKKLGSKESVASTKKQQKNSVSAEQCSPLQQIKRQCQSTQLSLQGTLQQLLTKLNERKQKLTKKEKAKQKYEQRILANQQQITLERESRTTLKKEIEKQKIILDTIEGEVDVVKEVQKIEEEIKYIEVEADKEITRLEKDIQSTKKDGEEKLEILKDMKFRLHKIQTDYAKVCEEIEDKRQIKGKIKITKSGLSRLYYSKKISEMEIRWRETQKESKKLNDSVATIKEEIKRTLSYIQVSQNQIQSYAQTNKLKNQQQHVAFKEIFQQCQKSFKQTIKFIEEINQTKNQIQEYEMKVHGLAAHDYKEGMKKINSALDELKREIKELKTKK